MEKSSSSINENMNPDPNTGKTAGKQMLESENESNYRPGLCETCFRAENCGFRQNISPAVIGCDEFESGPAAGASVRDESRSQGFKGLCINCDVRRECKIPKPAEGVWHCEGYK